MQHLPAAYNEIHEQN